MFTDNPLLIAFNNDDFVTAGQLLQSGEKIPVDVQRYDRTHIYGKIARAADFGLLNALLDNGSINNDLYEYDEFQYSIFEALFKYLPVTEASVKSFSDFTGKFDNINDEVKGATLLSFALQQGADPLIIQSLIDSGCRADFKNTAEDNLISQVVRINMMPSEKQLAYIDLLIKAGVTVTEPNVERQTALHIAVERDKNDLIPVLLANGAAPNEQDWKGNTPFFYALVHKQDADIYSKLSAAASPDFNIENKQGQTMLSEYMRMMQAGERGMALLAQLIDDGADMEQQSPYYGTPKSGWAWAAEKPVALLQMLLDKTGRDVNVQDNEGNTLLHMVCAIDSNYEQETARELYKKVKLLLEKGADAGITNNKDETALMLASKDNLKTKIVELLLTKGNR